jgi:hypothetical protein
LHLSTPTTAPTRGPNDSPSNDDNKPAASASPHLHPLPHTREYRATALAPSTPTFNSATSPKNLTSAHSDGIRTTYLRATAVSQTHARRAASASPATLDRGTAARRASGSFTELSTTGTTNVLTTI